MIRGRPHDFAIARPASRSGRRGALASLALTVLAALGGPPALGATPWDLAALMHLMAARKSGEARFHETKTVAMLDAPVKSSGILRFAAPDMLEMHTLEPSEQRLVVRGRQVSVELDGRSRQFDLDQAPAAGALVEGIRSTLVGDLAGLQRAYRTRLEGERARWTLVLVPRLAAARARVSEIDVSGSEASVHEIAVFQTDGDRSWMRIHELPRP